MWSCVSSKRLSSGLCAEDPPKPLYPQYPSETPTHFTPVSDTWDYELRDVMIPMRNGVKLHTVILVPKGASHAGMLLTRTPYEAKTLTSHTHSGHLSSQVRVSGFRSGRSPDRGFCGLHGTRGEVRVRCGGRQGARR